MKYTIRQEKSYEKGADAVFEAAIGAVTGLEGKVLKQDAGTRSIEAQFNKTIHGKVLGDRTRMEAAINGDNGAGNITVEIYPIDPVGRQLQFGARKGVGKAI